MIGSWLIKVIVGIAVAGFLVMELGSPLIIRAQVDDAAHEIATEVAFRLRDSFTQETLDRACAEEAEKKEVAADCTVDADRNVVVTATKKANSLLFHKIGPLKDWYEVEITATAKVQ